MKELRLLQDGEIVIIDANIIIYAATSASLQCTTFLNRCAANELKGVIAANTLGEVMHRLMMIEAREKGWLSKSNPTRQLAGEPEKVRTLFHYREAVLDVLSSGIYVEPVQKEDFIAAMKIQKDTGLLTNDALLAAVTSRLSLRALASADRNLDKFSETVLYSPDDIAI